MLLSHTSRQISEWWQLQQNPYARSFAWSVLCSMLIHLAVVLFLIFTRDPPLLPLLLPAIVVDLVEDDTELAIQPSSGLSASAPPAPARDPLPQQAGPKRASPTISELFALAEKAHEPIPAGSVRDSGAAAPALGRPGNADLKDYIRAQVERRWQFDATRRPADWIVKIRLVMDSNGVIESVDVIEDPHFENDPYYEKLALSARNAALLSSPLQLPVGMTNIPREMMLELNTRDAAR